MAERINHTPRWLRPSVTVNLVLMLALDWSAAPGWAWMLLALLWILCLVGMYREY
jgi:hypothetical protein